MKKTEHYDLNQWELSDRIRMEDFNADNAKIAAALAGKLGQVEVISSFDIPWGGGLGIPFTRSDWGDWSCIGIVCDIQTRDTSADDTFTINIDGSQLLTTKPGSIIVLLLPWHDGSGTIRYLCLGPSCTFGTLDTAYTDMSFINLAMISKGQFCGKLTRFGIK